jgi:rSAM/selenodomain-associated transferase 2
MLERGGRPAISIIVPVLNERALVPSLLATLEPFLGLHEIIISDGGSDDGTREALRERPVAKIVEAPRGRASQMNAAARVAKGSALLFLHADTSIQQEGPELALLELDRGADAGCFEVSIKSRHTRLRFAGKLQSLRSRLLPSATGDQGMFFRADVFHALGGYDESLPICEDLDLVRRFIALRGARRFACVPHPVETSGRRWEKSGINRTIALMWGLRLAYHAGVPPSRLARFYGQVR